MIKIFSTAAILACCSTAVLSQNFKMQYSFEAVTDALFFRYDPRVNIPMSSYVYSIKDWTQLISDEVIDVEEIFTRLEPKTVIFQPRVAANIHLNAPYLKGTFGVSTGRFEFRNFSWHGEALFQYNFKETCPNLTLEAGYMVINDNSFGPEAAIRAARDTPKEIKEKMRRFMTEQLFERPMSKGLKMGAYWNLVDCLDLSLTSFIDFTKRQDEARYDYVSLGLRARLESL